MCVDLNWPCSLFSGSKKALLTFSKTLIGAHTWCVMWLTRMSTIGCGHLRLKEEMQIEFTLRLSFQWETVISFQVITFTFISTFNQASQWKTLIRKFRKRLTQLNFENWLFSSNMLIYGQRLPVYLPLWK